jgi:hypothetical protein
MPIKLELDTVTSFLWNMPGLNQAQFYGAAYCLSLKQRQQKGTQAALETYLSSDTNELAHDDAAVINVFLGRLVLLFARFKYTSRTPANVTATGLVVDGNCWVFYVSKNGGPWEGDEAFAEMLQVWINSELADEPGGYSGEDGIWKAMEEFWEERVTHYVKKIIDNYVYLPIHRTIPTGQVQLGKSNWASPTGQVQLGKSNWTKHRETDLIVR